MFVLVIGLTAAFLLYKLLVPSDQGESKVNKALGSISQKIKVEKLKHKLNKETDKLKREESNNEVE
jgi:hypothetical protein